MTLVYIGIIIMGLVIGFFIGLALAHLWTLIFG